MASWIVQESLETFSTFQGNVAILTILPVGTPFTFSSDGNFDEMIDFFHRGQVPNLHPNLCGGK